MSCNSVADIVGLSSFV